MSVKIFALAAFLFFAPAVSQAANIVHVTGTVAKAKWQVRSENGTPGAFFTLTPTTKTIISDPAPSTNAEIFMDMTDAMNHRISGYINIAGKNNSTGLSTGGLYLQFSGDLLPVKNGSLKELSQCQIVQGYLLLNDGSAYNPEQAQDGFIGTDNDQVAVFSGTVTATVVDRGKDSSGNSIWTASFTVYPNSADIQYIIPDIGSLAGPSTGAPAILTITIPPVKFTTAP